MPRMLLAALALSSLAANPALAQSRPTSSGSGFVVSADRALTNFHVVDGCAQLTVRNARNQTAPATVAATDPARDLALVSIPARIVAPLVFRSAPPVERGEEVVTYGFPLTGLLSSGPSLTTGNISALAGLRDNAVQYQISAPVQPGNSGGPLLDSHGHVVGVVVAKLNALRIAQMTGGDIPQNVNFAIKGSEAVSFMGEHDVTPQTAVSDGPDLRPDKVGAIANVSTLFIQCFGGRGAATQAADRPNGQKPADDPSFRLTNESDAPITQVFATPAGRPNWGRSRLDNNTIAPHAARLFTIPRDGNCVFDLKVVFEGGRARERKEVNLCKLTDLPVQ